MKDPRSIHFISPLPIEECVSRLKRIAYSGKHKDYLIVDSITQKEYVIKSYAQVASGRTLDLVEVVDGRLYTHRNGGTDVYARLIPMTAYILLGAFLIALAIFALSVRGTGSECLFVIATLAGIMFGLQGLLNTQANEVLDQIERLLYANSVQPSNSNQPPEPPVEIPRKRYYDV